MIREVPMIKAWNDVSDLEVRPSIEWIFVMVLPLAECESSGCDRDRWLVWVLLPSSHAKILASFSLCECSDMGPEFSMRRTPLLQALSPLLVSFQLRLLVHLSWVFLQPPVCLWAPSVILLEVMAFFRVWKARRWGPCSGGTTSGSHSFSTSQVGWQVWEDAEKPGKHYQHKKRMRNKEACLTIKTLRMPGHMESRHHFIERRNGGCGCFLSFIHVVAGKAGQSLLLHSPYLILPDVPSPLWVYSKHGRK